MKTKMSKRLLTLVLAIVLTFALGVGALAAWNSFQGNDGNNGTASNAVTNPISTSVLNLTTNGYPFSGVDVTPVINDHYAYTLYNGGDVNGTAGGARMSCVDLNTNATVWNEQIDDLAENAQQLSTPYYDTVNDMLFVGTNSTENGLAGVSLSQWTGSGIVNGALVIPANSTVSITYSNLALDGDYSQAYFMTGITPSGNLTGSVTLVNNATHVSYNYGTSYAYAGYEFGLYNNSGTTVPAGVYTVTITLTSDVAVNSTVPISCVESYWTLFMVDASDGSAAPLTDGAGQINTPITAYGQYLYFGIYEGDRCYYQFDVNNDSLIAYQPNNGEDFYWAGAAVVDGYVVFGSESGKVYKRPIGATFGSATGAVYDLNNYDPITVPNPGAVRSSICYDGSNFYFTSNGGYLWKLDTALSTAYAINLLDSTYVTTTTSTPVVSANGYIYVGGYKTVYNSSTWTTDYFGEVYAIPVSNFTQPAMQSLWVSNTEAVQSSIVVYSTTNSSTGIPVDYLYFTSNSANGKGYCLSFVPGSVVTTTVWTTGNVGTGYTLQGVAVSDNGVVVFGNDDNELYIVK